MDKTYTIKGIAKCVLVYRGMVIQPRTQFDLILDASEYNAFKDHIEILEIIDNSVKEEEPKTIIEILQPKEELKEEVKGVKANGSTKQRTNASKK